MKTNVPEFTKLTNTCIVKERTYDDHFQNNLLRTYIRQLKRFADEGQIHGFLLTEMKMRPILLFLGHRRQKTAINCLASLREAFFIHQSSEKPKDALTPERTHIFLSYHPVDALWKDALMKHFHSVQEAGSLYFEDRWAPGRTEEALKSCQKRASIIISFVTPDYVNHKEIRALDFPEINGRHHTTFWIPVRPTVIAGTPFRNIHPALQTETPLSSLSDYDQEKHLIEIAYRILHHAFPNYEA